MTTYLPEPLRRRAYCYVTWVTRLLSREDRCLWRAWYKVTHKYEKRPEDADRADFFREYTERHDEIVARRAAELKAEGWLVKVEDEAEFKLEGAAADLSGRPDLVALKGDEALVVDGKSGRAKSSDHWQVLVYQIALPLTWLTGHRLRGEVEYEDHREQVRPVGAAERERFVEIMREVSGEDTPPATPSERECKFCDVARCPVRVEPVKRDGSAKGMF